MITEVLDTGFYTAHLDARASATDLAALFPVVAFGIGVTLGLALAAERDRRAVPS